MCSYMSPKCFINFLTFQTEKYNKLYTVCHVTLPFAIVASMPHTDISFLYL
jgi:hypothetical protein